MRPGKALIATTALIACSDYPLDSVPRGAPPRGRLRCPEVLLVTHRGTALRYSRAVRVYRGFRPKLVRFERLARETALEVYGRAPRRMVHLGAYNCRRIRGWPRLLSEHALGNAIDVAGFDFGPATRGSSSSPPGVPRESFCVRLAKHWHARARGDRIHRRFLRAIDRRVRSAGIFTVVLGPGAPGHHDHYHFDHGPSAGRKALAYALSFFD